MKNQVRTHVGEGSVVSEILVAPGSLAKVSINYGLQQEVGKSENSKSVSVQQDEDHLSQIQEKNDGWTQQVENRLFQLHNIHGNRWAKISHFMPGKSDNCIKNHFYCTLRKAFRRINRYISENKSKLRMKEIKDIVLSKVISVAEQRFEAKLEVTEELINACCNIKNNLLKFSKDLSVSEATESEVLQLIAEINQFSRTFKKRKAKRPKKQPKTIQEPGELEPKSDDGIEEYPGQPTQTVLDRRSPIRIELEKSLEFNREEIGADFAEQDGFIYNFNQKSPIHLNGLDIPPLQDQTGIIGNALSLNHNNPFNDLQQYIE